MKWGGFPLVEVDKDNMFELKNLKAARLWMLPPAAMEVALELLTEDQIAHPQWPHVFLVPRLMTHLWWRDLGKEAGIFFNVPAGVPFWGAQQYEPLTVAILFPLSHAPSHTGPWVVKRTDVGANFEQSLVQGFRGDGPDDPAELHGLDGSVCVLWKDPASGSRAILQQLLAWAGTFPPCRNVWCGKCYKEAINNPFLRLDQKGVGSGSNLMGLNDENTLNWYQCGQDGDHLMGITFECDLYSFRNVLGRDPVFGNLKDLSMLTAIRRVSLDVMWARRPGTVAKNWARARADFNMVSNHLSIEAGTLLPRLGNPTLEDRVGMTVALTMVCTSLQAGRNASNIQVDTMRKTQTWYGNTYNAGTDYTCQMVVGLDQKKQYLSMSHTFDKWFSCFMRGAHLRMGMVRCQIEALTSPLVLGVCAAGEDAWRQSPSKVDWKMIEDTVCFMLIAFGAGMQGEEVPLVLLEGLLTF